MKKTTMNKPYIRLRYSPQEEPLMHKWLKIMRSVNQREISPCVRHAINYFAENAKFLNLGTLVPDTASLLSEKTTHIDIYLEKEQLKWVTSMEKKGYSRSKAVKMVITGGLRKTDILEEERVVSLDTIILLESNPEISMTGFNTPQKSKITQEADNTLQKPVQKSEEVHTLQETNSVEADIIAKIPDNEGENHNEAASARKETDCRNVSSSDMNCSAPSKPKGKNNPYLSSALKTVMY